MHASCDWTSTNESLTDLTKPGGSVSHQDEATMAEAEGQDFVAESSAVYGVINVAVQ